MNRRVVLPLLCGFPIALAGAEAGVAAAPQSIPIPDPQEARLAQLASQLPKMYLPKLRDYLRAKLGIAYAIAVSAATGTEHRRAIEIAQQQWLEFLEAQRAVAAFNAQGGSYAVPAAMEEEIYHLRHHIFNLVTPYLQGWGTAPYTPAIKQP